MAEKISRKKYLINKEFQIKFIIRVFFIAFIAIAAVGGMLFYFNDKTLSFSAYQQVLNLKSASDMLLPTILAISAITAAVTFVIIFFRFMLETHKIAGPVYRLGKVFESVEHGDLTVRVNLRKNDELKDVAGQFNTMADALSQKFEKSKKISEELKNTLENCNENSPEEKEKVRKLLNNLTDILDTIKL